MNKLPFPAAVLDQNSVFLGKTRSGKSSKLRLIVEHLLETNKPVGIIDPKGDWWGIKSSADGKSAGYKVVIFGGEHADVQIDRHSGKEVAELVAAANRPYLIDMKGWRVGERTEFFIDFAATLFKLTKGHRWLVIDECHNFAPQGKIHDPQAGEMLHWANRLASEGSGMGLLLLSASQRPQKVHKDFLTSHETLFALRVVHKLDRDADKDWIDGCGDPALGKQVLDSLAQMQRTQGWVWSPEIGFGPKLIDFPMFKTYDSFKPQAQRKGKLKGWASVDLDDVKSKLAAVIEKNKADDPKALRTAIATLQAEKAKLAADNNRLSAAGATAQAALLQKKTDPDALKAAEQKGFEQAKKKLISAAKRAVNDIMRASMTAIDKRLREAFAGAKEQIVDDFKQLASVSNVIGADLTFEPSVTAPAPAPALQQPARPAQQKSAAVQRPPRDPASAENEGDLPKGERAVLIAIAQHAGGVTREQLTVLTGYKKTSRDSYIKRLRARGFVGDAADRLVASEDGIAALGSDYEPMPIGDALREHVMQNLPEGERRILEIACDAYPGDVSREQIGEACTYKKTSRDSYIKRLRARQLVITSSAGVRASETLFG